MSFRSSKEVPAVVVGAGLNGLGVLRSLASAGVPVAVVDSSAEQPAMRSRHGQKCLVVGTGPEALVKTLEQIARSAATRPVLILTQEYAVATVAAYRERLAATFLLTIPNSETLLPLLSKGGVQSALDAAGARVPQTVRVQQESDIEHIDRLALPIVIKPSRRNEGYERAFRKAYYIFEREQAHALVKRMLRVLPDIVVQEFIEGSDSDIYFCLQYLPFAGGLPTSFVGRKIRSWPPKVGGTASCTAAPEASELIDVTTAFFRHVGFVGLASMEYKRDTNTGQYVVVEPTVGRTDYQEEVATLNGVNIPLAAYLDLTGAPYMPATAVSPARVWRDRVSDLRSAALDPDAGGRMPERSRVVQALWRMSDPLPTMALIRRGLRARIARLAQRRGPRSRHRSSS